jgi:hypothetical protein
MSYSAARWLQKYLIDQGIAANPDTAPLGNWPIYLDGMPDGAGVPNDCLAIFDTVGRKDGRYMRSGQTVIHPGVMVHVRAVDRDDAYSKIDAVLNKFDGLLRAQIIIGSDSTVIQSVSIRGNPMSLGEVPGDVRRFGFSLNAIVSFA